MKDKRAPSSRKSKRTSSIDLKESRLPTYGIQVNWRELIESKKPHIELLFGSKEDRILYRSIETLADVMGFTFQDATHWVVREALAERFEAARMMVFCGEPWDPDVRFICRAVALQLCKFYKPGGVIQSELIDHMLPPLLSTDADCRAFQEFMSVILSNPPA